MQQGNVEPCEVLEWDTRFFGSRIARVRGDTLTQGQVRQIDAWCRQNGVRCLYFLSRSDDSGTTRVAEDSNFRLVDIRMTFGYKVSDSVGDAKSCANGAAIVRPSRLEDIAALQSIAREIYRDTRFYYDAHFPRPLCDSLYETWIKRSCEGYADVVLVAELDREPVGYVSCHLNGEPRTGRIGLVGVANRAQGRGVGRTLILGSLEWFLKQGVKEISVVTQGRNCAAQRLYQRCSFVTQAVQLWYHKWYARSGVADE